MPRTYTSETWTLDVYLSWVQTIHQRCCFLYIITDDASGDLVIARYAPDQSDLATLIRVAILGRGNRVPSAIAMRETLRRYAGELAPLDMIQFDAELEGHRHQLATEIIRSFEPTVRRGCLTIPALNAALADWLNDRAGASTSATPVDSPLPARNERLGEGCPAPAGRGEGAVPGGGR